MRDRVGADLVHLIVGESDVGGRARLPGAFGLSKWPGGAVPHELGHNLGLRHDRYVWSTEDDLSPDPAYGYTNPEAPKAGSLRSDQWRTIMAYPDQCREEFTYCPRIPRFSNPRQRYNGERLGVPFDDEAVSPGVAGPADAAAVLSVTGRWSRRGEIVRRTPLQPRARPPSPPDRSPAPAAWSSPLPRGPRAASSPTPSLRRRRPAPARPSRPGFRTPGRSGAGRWALTSASSRRPPPK